jgi:hypothetical protein
MPKPLPKLPNPKTPGAVGRLEAKVTALMQKGAHVAGGSRTPKPLPKVPATSRTPSAPSKGPATPWKKGVIPDASTSQDDKIRKQRVAISSLAQIARIEHESQVTYDETLESLSDFTSRFLESKGEDGSARSVGQHLQVMAEYLQGCDVTTNFKANEWFRQPNGTTTYLGMFEKNKANIDGRQQDVARATQSGTPDIRDRAEMQKMFPNRLASPANAARGKFNLIANAPNRFAASGGITPVKVPGKNGMEDEVYKAANPHYIGSTRPRYTALNYTGLPGGAVASVFEHKPASSIAGWYLECHIYEELRFKGNLKCVRLHKAEEVGNVRANVEDFCKRKGVPLIPL